MTKKWNYFCKLVPYLNTIKMIQFIPFPRSQQLTPEIEHIYTDSFPPAERRNWDEVQQILQQPIFNLLQVFDNQELTGIAAIWDLTDFRFIEHLAIKASARGKGIGTLLINQIIINQPTRLILEVEEPLSHSAQRRIGFYTKLGFSVCDRNYWQPAYSADKSEVKMRLMSYPDKIQPEEFEQVKRQIYRNVYQLTEPIDLK